MEFAEYLAEKKGLEIRIQCSKGIRSDHLGVAGEVRKLCVKLDYIGPAVRPAEAPEREDDPYTYRYICSPFPAVLNTENTFGLVTEGQTVWTTYWNSMYLRDEQLYPAGLKFVYTVPERLAGIHALMQVYAEDVLLAQRELTEAGTFEMTLDVRPVVQDLAAYLQDAHRMQKILLREFIRVCEKYDLRYYLICGSALGVLRAHDFIPWDDDTDVAMPRRDYDRLKQIADTEWPVGSEYHLLLPDQLGGNVFLDYMTRLLYMKETADNDLFDRVTPGIRKEYTNHPLLDIYILENGSDRLLLHRIQTSLIRGIYVLAMGHRTVFDEEGYQYTDHKNKLTAARFLMRLGKHIPVHSLLAWYDHVCRWFRKPGKYCFQSNGYIGCIPWRFEQAWFAEGKRDLLQDLAVVLPANPDLYLQRQYGAYEKPAHGRTRKPAHRRKP